MAIDLRNAGYYQDVPEMQGARLGQQQAAALGNAPSVGVAPPVAAASLGQGGALAVAPQNNKDTSFSTAIQGPGGAIMSAPVRNKEGQLAFRPGESGFQSGLQRANLDPYAQRLGQVGDIQMQRGLTGATLAGMPQIDADRMRAAQINRTGFDQQAMQQNALARQGNQAIGMLQGAAQGNAPSAALIQQQQGIEAAQRAQMAMAASARGGADQRAAAMRQGQMAGADMAMQGVGQASALRAQEMAANRGQLVGAIGQQQGLAQQQGAQQANIAQAQAALGQQAGLANQGSNLQAALANQQGYLGAAGMDQGMIGQGAGVYGAGAQLGMAGLGFNNAQYQQDFQQQMAMRDMDLARYGIDKGVAAQRYAADQAQSAAMWGAGINAAGQLLGAGMQAFTPQQPARKY